MLPNDPIILLSYVNTQLRDNYPNLEEFCRAMDAEPEALCAALAKIDYYYDAKANQFV